MSRAAERLAQLDCDAEAEARQDPALLAVAEILTQHVPWRKAIGPARDVYQAAAWKRVRGAELSVTHVEYLLDCQLDMSVSRACAPAIAEIL